jgi:phosphate transport system permease protein
MAESRESYKRYLLKTGNRDTGGADFVYVMKDWLSEIHYPQDVIVVERREWGNLYGRLLAVKEQGVTVADGEAAWSSFNDRLARSRALFKQIRDIEKHEIGAVNHRYERMRLAKRSLELEFEDRGEDPALALKTDKYRRIEAQRGQLDKEYAVLQEQLIQLYAQINRDSYVVQLSSGQAQEQDFAKAVRAYQPNAMSRLQKAGFYIEKLWEFVSDEPREANTEGGIFPAIFGTVMMVILMAILVTPFGVVAALYLREYARQGWLTRTIRVAVNNLAGVPSIVYGVFGLGFFVYFLGGQIDDLFFRAAQPSPTFGTPGLLWASLTLAILTLPVVIVATEEGLARIPRSLREASLALGATKAETLWRVVLPMASPAMMTGLILAIARAAGEVAPLMLVGVVKLAPSLPLDGNIPFLHLDRKFMHLGFHIYDVGFQSPNVEAARPLVYATAFLLVLVIVVLNLAAVRIRNHLREKYRALEH